MDKAELMKIVSHILQIVLDYLIPLGAAALVGYLTVKIKPILEDKTTKNIIEILVNAAEQLYKAGEGEQKLNYVLEEAEKWLKQYHITLDMKRLRALVEAEVLKINMEKRLVA